jgi:hypothetical protein
MKKFIHARPSSGSFFHLPHAKPMKIRPKNGSARLRMESMRRRLRQFGVPALMPFPASAG